MDRSVGLPGSASDGGHYQSPLSSTCRAHTLGRARAVPESGSENKPRKHSESLLCRFADLAERGSVDGKCRKLRQVSTRMTGERQRRIEGLGDLTSGNV